MGITRRMAVLGGAALAGGAVGATVATRLAPWRDTMQGVALTDATPAGWLNDASGLSATPVRRHLVMAETGEAALSRLRAALAQAQAEGRPLAVSAARHSMGGQAIPRDGTAITWDAAQIEIDRTARTARVPSGARWRNVIAAADPLGLSPAVMQSNNDFGVGATFAVNAHGWPVPFGPMGATVREIDLMLADGSVVTASRDREPDLFALSMGGYGLVGIILSLTVDLVPNTRLVPTYDRMAGRDLGTAFMQALADPAVSMAYGRLSVGRGDFLRDGLMISFRPDADQSDLPPASGSGRIARAAARVYRAQLYREPAKGVRWWLETSVNPLMAGPVTRNSLINEPVETLDDGLPDRTDILHEYFVAPDRFADFVAMCRAAIPTSYQEMLNVTIRYVGADPVSRLAYAPVPRLAAVMSFSQEMSARAEADMARLTRSLIDGVTAIGGSYYLPYRPHATVAQLHAAYPGAGDFAAAKRKLDPRLTFRNGLWDSYLGV